MRCLTSEKTESSSEEECAEPGELFSCGSEITHKTVCEPDRNTQWESVMLSVVMLSDALKIRSTTVETNVVVLEES